MTRIFLTLAIVAMMLLAIALILGLNIGEPGQLVLDGRAAAKAGDQAKIKELIGKEDAIKSALGSHRLTGIGVAIFTMLVHSLSITYFVGTSKWCREVAETYGLDRDFIVQGQTNKRKNFPWGVTGMLAVVLVAALGAAADPTRPTAVVEQSLLWVTPHLIAACAMIVFTMYCYYREYLQIAAQGELIQRMMIEVQRIRREQGLNE